MINYQVHYDEEFGGIYDKSCHFICDVSSKTHGNEIVKRINMHDELVAILKDIALVDGGMNVDKFTDDNGRTLTLAELKSLDSITL